jgi:hypothetical protein
MNKVMEYKSRVTDLEKISQEFASKYKESDKKCEELSEQNLELKQHLAAKEVRFRSHFWLIVLSFLRCEYDHFNERQTWHLK